MTRQLKFTRTCLLMGWMVGTLGLVCFPQPAAAENAPRSEFAQQATWKVPSWDDVISQVRTWMDETKASAETRAKIDELLQANPTVPAAPAGAGDVLDRLAAILALGQPEAREIVEFCARPKQSVKTPHWDLLTDDKTPAFERFNLRLLLGRWLAQERLYDEAHEQLDELKPEDVVDPSTLLFYQAIVHQRMLRREAGLEAITRLLEQGDHIPRRYEAVARLMQADLTGLKDESLDHIARRMDDVRRRLDLGRAGPKVREVEDGVIASLDKLIEEMEAAAAAAAAAAGASGQGSMRPSAPAQDSTPMGGKGPGNVARKNIGNKSGWGDLPPKQREEALQQIGKEFPAHYRDVIEQYFRKLASEANPE